MSTATMNATDEALDTSVRLVTPERITFQYPFTTPCTLCNISNNSGASFKPVTVATPDGIHVTWADTTPGNLEAFYRRGTVP